MYQTNKFFFGLNKSIRKFLGLTIISCALFFFFGTSSAFAYTNLLTNPGAETNNMTGWIVDNNGGDGWATDWNGPGHSDERVFATSHGWDTRHQTIDLLSAGYTEGQLDSGTFDVKMSEWIYTRGDQGGKYYLNFKLLADDGTTVLDSYTRGSMGSPITLGSGVPWFQESHTFNDIPTGTRYVYFEDGGRDNSGWAGHYGTNFDDASVVVSDTAFYELSYTAGSNGTLTGTRTQTLSSGSNGSAVTPVPAVGYAFTSWSDASTNSPRTDTNVVGDISVSASFADAAGPVISGISTSSITQNSANITWTTNEAASSMIYYGTTVAYGIVTSELDTTPKVNSHLVSINGLNCGTSYSFKVTSKDELANISLDNNNAFITSECPAGAVSVLMLQQQSQSATPKIPETLETIALPPVLPVKVENTPFVFKKTLKQGQANEDIRKLQQFLKDQGPEIYPEGKVSGVFGRLTKKAVIRFQERYADEILISFKNKVGTGIVGEHTLKKINELLD